MLDKSYSDMLTPGQNFKKPDAGIETLHMRLARRANSVRILRSPMLGLKRIRAVQQCMDKHESEF